MKVLLTGADGLLGSNVIRELLSRHYEVYAFVESGKAHDTLPEEDIMVIEGNILNKEEVMNAVEGKDYVIHCAANTNIWPTRDETIYNVNVEGTEHIIDACLTHNVKRLISVGTANSFASGDKFNPGTEENPYKAYTYQLDYMDSKRLAQDLVLDAVKRENLNAIIVNPTFMIGPYDSKPSSGAMIQALAHGKIPGSTPGGKNYINVKDAATGIVNALKLGRIGECYILGSANLTFREMYEKVANVIQVSAPNRQLPPVVVKTLGSVNSFLGQRLRFKPTITREMAVLSCEEHYYSGNKAVRELLLPQTPIEEGIRECYNWLLQNGRIKRTKS